MRRGAILLLVLALGCATDEPGEDSLGSASAGPGTSASTSSAGTGDSSESVGETTSTGPTTSSTSVDPDESSGTSGASGAESSTGDPPQPADAIAVVVGYGTRRARSEDGVVWTDFVEVDPNGGDDDQLLRGVGYGDGVFLAVGGAAAGFSMRSADGIAWEDETHVFTSFVSDVAWQDGVFVAGGGNGLRARSLDGGVTWQDFTPYYAGHWRAIAAGNGIVVAVGHTYGDTNVGMITTTVDGASWSGEQLVGAPYGGLGIAFGAGVFVARDSEGDLRSSSDGQAWSEVVLDLEGGGPVVFADGGFVTAGGDAYWTSSDGAQWDELASPSVREPVAWIHGQWLTLGWPASIDASSDLQAWQNAFAPGGSGFTDVATGSPGR